jgi:two-component system cell cycle sensor histidine kinase/response regulator CckA
METILIVDDEPEIRSLARDILEPKGYAVLEALDGAEALQIAGRHPGPIHLVLTDVLMPNLNGPDMAERLKPMRPDAKVVFMSGYTSEVMGQYGVVRSSAPFVAKPFSPDGLARKLREVLDYSSPFKRPVSSAA